MAGRRCVGAAPNKKKPVRASGTRAKKKRERSLGEKSQKKLELLIDIRKNSTSSQQEVNVGQGMGK